MERLFVSCPTCLARIRAPVQLIGQSRRCPRCNVVLLIRPPRPIDSESLLVMDAIVSADASLRRKP